MPKGPWTDPDPQPGDFDAFLESIDPNDPEQVQVHEGNPDAKARLLPEVEAEEAKRLIQLAHDRGQDIEEVLADLGRSAA